jgi:hypothetical protein
MFPSLLEISLKRRKRNDRVFNNEFVVESAKSRLICGRERHDSLKSKQLDDPWSLAPVERSLVYGCWYKILQRVLLCFEAIHVG